MPQIMHALDYRKTRDRRGVNRVPLVGKALSLAVADGLYEGAYIREFSGNVLSEAGVETFADLRLDSDDGRRLPPGQDYRLVVMATDITNGCLVRLPWDYQRLYGLDPDRQLVVDAVRASMAIPFYFKPVRLQGADGTLRHVPDGADVLQPTPRGALGGLNRHGVFEEGEGDETHGSVSFTRGHVVPAVVTPGDGKPDDAAMRDVVDPVKVFRGPLHQHEVFDGKVFDR